MADQCRWFRRIARLTSSNNVQKDNAPPPPPPVPDEVGGGLVGGGLCGGGLTVIDSVAGAETAPAAATVNEKLSEPENPLVGVYVNPPKAAFVIVTVPCAGGVTIAKLRTPVKLLKPPES